jgi:DNA polymerase III delta prime subunit
MPITAEDLKTTSFLKLFAPTTLDKITLLPRIKDIATKGLYENFLYYGPQGMGKSTLARILATDYVHKYVNTSLMGNIDFLREELSAFCESNSVALDKPSQKVVWFDEIDGASAAFFDGLRGFMDVYPHVKFIATCNKFHKVPAPLASRFNCVNFGPENDDERIWLSKVYKKRFTALATNLKLSFESDDVISYICNKRFPDFRESLKILQSLYLSHGKDKVVDMQSAAAAAYEFIELYEKILTPGADPVKLHAYLLTNYADRPSDVITQLDNSLVEYIIEKKATMTRIIPDIIIENARHQHMLIFCLDQSTVMKSLCYVVNKLVTATTLQ